MALTDAEIDFVASTFELAREGRAEDLGAAPAAGVPVNLTNTSGDTLLILAAYHDRPEVVSVLLAAGADSERVNDRGQTALGAAAFRRSAANVSALLAAGASPRTGARSALDVARFFALDEMVRLLESADDVSGHGPGSTRPVARAPRPESSGSGPAAPRSGSRP